MSDDILEEIVVLNPTSLYTGYNEFANFISKYSKIRTHAQYNVECDYDVYDDRELPVYDYQEVTFTLTQKQLATLIIQNGFYLSNFEYYRPNFKQNETRKIKVISVNELWSADIISDETVLFRALQNLLAPNG